MGGIGVQNLPLTERKSRLAFGLTGKKPTKETELNGKLDVKQKLGKRTERATRGLEPSQLAQGFQGGQESEATYLSRESAW
jgi:hypothetical protein